MNQNFILMTPSPPPPPPQPKEKKNPSFSITESINLEGNKTHFNGGYVLLEGVRVVCFSNYLYFTFITGNAFLHAVETIKVIISLLSSLGVLM